MNESSVSSPFMKQLRERLPGAVVLKHSDTSMVGLPDCSVSYRGKTIWLEFKLITPTKIEVHHNAERGWSFGRYWIKAREDSPTQAAMVDKLDEQTQGAWYIFWVRKCKAVAWCRPGHNWSSASTTPQVVEFFAKLLEG